MRVLVFADQTHRLHSCHVHPAAFLIPAAVSVHPSLHSPPGGRWERALEVFELLRSRGCKPDGGVFGSLLGALAAGGQWQRSMAAFSRLQVRRRPCASSGFRQHPALCTFLTPTLLDQESR